MSPDCPNDLFRAHEAIYVFVERFLGSGRVLDLGCGTGYGSARLAGSSSAEVVGVDLDRRNVRFARRRFGRPGPSGSGTLRFVAADAQALPEDLGSFGLIVASNVLEHLTYVDRALDGLARRLEPTGTLVAVVPPITDDSSLAENEKNPYHRSNLRVDEWRRRLEARFEEVSTYRQLPPVAAEGGAAARPLDFTDPFPSRHAAGDFRFVAVSPDRLGREPTLGAVFVCRKPRQASP